MAQNSDKFKFLTVVGLSQSPAAVGREVLVS